MLYAIAFIFMFVIGGVSGVMLAVAPADFQYSDSYFLVAHIHYVLVGGSLLALIAGLHYWFPKITGRLLDEHRGRIAFWLIFIGFNVTFFPMHFLGLLGMPRRVATYPPNLGLATLNLISTIGVFPLGAGLITLLYNVRASARHGAVAGPDPWDGRTLEWATASPPPEYNFAEIPLVRGRDALWVEKRYGDGRLAAAPDVPEPDAHGLPPGTVHMPGPTPLPAVLGAAVMLLAYAVIYVSWIPAAIGVLAALGTIVALMYDHDPGHVLPTAAGPS